MCPHNEFDIIYYAGDVMLRRCKHCGSVEMQLDWWCTIEAIQAALKTIH